VDLLVKNRGRSDETVLVEVTEKPKDWTLEIKRFGTIVRGVSVEKAAERMSIDTSYPTLRGPSGDKLVGAYSRGMRQRLGIAELLIKDRKVLTLDEPTLGLEPDGTNRMLDLIVSLSRDRSITVMLSAHQLEQVQRICTRVGIMIKGKVVALGTIEELAKRKLGDAAGPNLEEIYMRYFKET
jgi:ABC-2 type transport system ATP-binding protein